MKLEELIKQLAIATNNRSENLSTEIRAIFHRCGIREEDDKLVWIEFFFESILERKEIKEQSFEKLKHVDQFYCLITELNYYQIYISKSENFGEDMNIEFESINVSVYISWEEFFFNIGSLS